MKKLYPLLVLLLTLNSYAQNKPQGSSVVKITPSMFDTTSDQLYLSTVKGWLFKKGNDTSWAKKDIDEKGWQKFTPALLTAAEADKNDRIECWFRIKIKLDSTFGNKTFGIKGDLWGAADYYINGKLVSSLGNTGENGQAFREFRPYPRTSVAVNLKPGVEYSVAIHFVDYVAPVPPRMLTSQRRGMRQLIRLTGPEHDNKTYDGMEQDTAWNTLWVSVTVILSLLFWLLYLRNRVVKPLRLIALNTTSLAVGMFFLVIDYNSWAISFMHWYVNSEAANFFLSLSVVLAPLVIAGIFERKTSKSVRVFIVAYAVLSIPVDFLPISLVNTITLCLFGITLGICLYYIFSSWKNLKGAQWAIVAGLLISIAGAIAFVLIESIMPVSPLMFSLLISVYVLAFPLSLMVYVAMRFKEILKEVQLNANQVVQLSEEKKQEALNRQKILEEEVSRQTAQIRANQAQLIQSEKMASLGELTAGIAHEIQNPLNFVNNFSELNTELVGEMKGEIDKGDLEEIRAIAIDIEENSKKINMHGKRADAIVKGMLQHSQAGSGTKEPMNINALADEYMRLSYHGLRAKDKDFNADLVMNFDEKLPKINIIPQDIGRVLLNLFNNAFYAVNQKAKKAGADYKPEVSVTTSSENGQVIIRVKDNGIGIPDAIKEKIMQPFFTTKPTGEGTGLGLSLTYDMVVKGHDGKIEVNSIEGEGSEFIIQLPIH